MSGTRCRNIKRSVQTVNRFSEVGVKRDTCSLSFCNIFPVENKNISLKQMLNRNKSTRDMEQVSSPFTVKKWDFLCTVRQSLNCRGVILVDGARFSVWTVRRQEKSVAVVESWSLVEVRLYY